MVHAFTTLHPDLAPHTINYKFIAAGNFKGEICNIK